MTPTERTADLISKLKSIPQKDWAETIKPIFGLHAIQVENLRDALKDLQDAANESHAPGDRGSQGRLRCIAAVTRANEVLGVATTSPEGP